MTGRAALENYATDVGIMLLMDNTRTPRLQRRLPSRRKTNAEVQAPVWPGWTELQVRAAMNFSDKVEAFGKPDWKGLTGWVDDVGWALVDRLWRTGNAPGGTGRRPKPYRHDVKELWAKSVPLHAAESIVRLLKDVRELIEVNEASRDGKDEPLHHPGHSHVLAAAKSVETARRALESLPDDYRESFLEWDDVRETIRCLDKAQNHLFVLTMLTETTDSVRVSEYIRSIARTLTLCGNTAQKERSKGTPSGRTEFACVICVPTPALDPIDINAPAPVPALHPEFRHSGLSENAAARLLHELATILVIRPWAGASDQPKPGVISFSTIVKMIRGRTPKRSPRD